MQNFRVSTVDKGPDWQHDHYDTREQAEAAAKAKAKGGCFAVVSHVNEQGSAQYLCEYGTEGGAA